MESILRQWICLDLCKEIHCSQRGDVAWRCWCHVLCTMYFCRLIL